MTPSIFGYNAPDALLGAPMRALLIASLLVACGTEDPKTTPNADDTGTGPTGPATCGEANHFDPYYEVPTAEMPEVRGWELKRGVGHVHSIYSHDACDEEGFLNEDGEQDYHAGVPNQQCFDDLRKGLCDAEIDFAFLTDHNEAYPDFEYPDVLLWSSGDSLVEVGGEVTANYIQCPDRPDDVLLSAGIDVDLIGFGLKRHVADTPEERAAIYGLRNQTTVDAIRSVGGLSFGGYVQRWDEQEFYDTEFDAIEIYNPAFTLYDNLLDAIQLIGQMNLTPDDSPVAELGLYILFEEQTESLRRWAVSIQDRRLPSFLGSNAHRNVLPEPLAPDGERLDSYRRTFHWFSNYALMPAGSNPTMDDYQDAVAAGRTFGAFDAMGTPSGFDYRAEAGGTVYEMGAEIDGQGEVTLIVESPTVFGLGPRNEEPVITSRIVKATPEGTWEEVASAEGTLTYVPTEPGAYRAEVHMLPNHLRPCLGSAPDPLVVETLWVYGNPIYVDMAYE